jgi:aminoglycoside 6-adenylyltransferase
MKYRLRLMIEWHARTRKGRKHDTWMRGRFLEEWADPNVVKGLKGTFAHYDENDLWCALQTTMSLFRQIATETAAYLNHVYPSLADEHATQLVADLLSERS